MTVDLKTVKIGDLVWAHTAGRWYRAKVHKVTRVKGIAKLIEVFFLADGTKATYEKSWLDMLRPRVRGQQTRAGVEAEEEEEKEEADEGAHVLYDGKRKKKKKLSYKKLRYDSLEVNTRQAEQELQRLLAARAGRRPM